MFMCVRKKRASKRVKLTKVQRSSFQCRVTEYFLRIYRSGAEKFDKLHLPWLTSELNIAKCIFITNWELSAFQNLEKFFINISNIRGTDGTLLQSLGRQTFSTSFYTVYLSFAFFNREGLKIIQVTIKCL